MRKDLKGKQGGGRKDEDAVNAGRAIETLPFDNRGTSSQDVGERADTRERGSSMAALKNHLHYNEGGPLG